MKYSDFSLYVRPEAQGAPDFLIERSVRDSAIDFCSRTDIYIPEPEFITIIAGVNEYAVSLPSGTELNHILDISMTSQHYHRSVTVSSCCVLVMRTRQELRHTIHREITLTFI